MLNKDEILKQTNSGLDVFKHYILGQWWVGRNFFNPLYEDCKASCISITTAEVNLIKLRTSATTLSAATVSILSVKSRAWTVTVQRILSKS
jgi:hypothetical protein